MYCTSSLSRQYVDSNEPSHAAVGEVIESGSEPQVVSPYVVAEGDHLMLSRHGSHAARAVLVELAGGAWELAHMDEARMAAALDVVTRYADVPVAVADASNIVPGEAYRTRDIVTVDNRHFGILRFSYGTAPRTLP